MIDTTSIKNKKLLELAQSVSADIPEVRNLDECYYSVIRDGAPQRICFTDLSEEERFTILYGMPANKAYILAMELSRLVRTIADEFDLCGVEEEE